MKEVAHTDQKKKINQKMDRCMKRTLVLSREPIKPEMKRNGMCRFFPRHCVSVKSVIKTMTLNYFMSPILSYAV